MIGPLVHCGRDCQKAHWPEHKTVCKKQWVDGLRYVTQKPKYIRPLSSLFLLIFLDIIPSNTLFFSPAARLYWNVQKTCFLCISLPRRPLKRLKIVLMSPPKWVYNLKKISLRRAKSVIFTLLGLTLPKLRIRWWRERRLRNIGSSVNALTEKMCLELIP